MSYLLIDPPVSPLSPPTAIQGWIDDLLHMAQDPAYVNTPAEQQIAGALRQARAWLAGALQMDGQAEPRSGEHVASLP